MFPFECLLYFFAYGLLCIRVFPGAHFSNFFFCVSISVFTSVSALLPVHVWMSYSEHKCKLGKGMPVYSAGDTEHPPKDLNAHIHRRNGSFLGKSTHL